MFTWSRVAACAALVGLTGCRCDQPVTSSRFGELDFVFEQGGVSITAPDGDYDFGKVGMGVKKSIKLAIQNRGQGSLDLVSLERLEGETVDLGDMTQASPVFVVPFTKV